MTSTHFALEKKMAMRLKKKRIEQNLT